MKPRTKTWTLLAGACGVLAWLTLLPVQANTPALAGILEGSALASSKETLDVWGTKLACLSTGMFIISLGRAQLDLRNSLARVDHALWSSVLIFGTAIGGAVAALGIGHESALLVGLLSLLMAIALLVAAIRNRVRLPALHGSFMLASTAALAGPAVLGVSAIEGARSIGTAAVITTLAILAMMLLSTSLLRANTRTAYVQSARLAAMQPERPEGNSSVWPDRPSRQAGSASMQSDLHALQARLLEGIKRSDRGHVGLALIWVKLEGLNEAHRMLGRELVDALIDGVEQRIDRALGGIPQVSRFGEANFTIVLEAVSGVEEVISRIEGIRDALTLPVDLGDGSIAISAGVGHALYPNDGGDPVSLYRTAARRASRTTRSAHRLKSVGTGQVRSRAM